MYVSTSGVIEAGEVKKVILIGRSKCEDEESLRIEYSIKFAKEDWVYLSKTVFDSKIQFKLG